MTTNCAWCGADGSGLSIHSIRRRTVFDIIGPQEILVRYERCGTCGRIKTDAETRAMLVGGKAKITRRFADLVLKREGEGESIARLAWKYSRDFGVRLPPSTLHDACNRREMELIDQKKNRRACGVA